MKTFYLQILEEDQAFYQGECQSLVIPSSDGALGILADHSSMVAALVPGELRYQPPGEKMYTVAVSEGLVKVENNEVLILAEAVESQEEIDTDRALRSAQEAQEVLKNRNDSWEYYAAQAALSRAVNRIRVKNKRDF